MKAPVGLLSDRTVLRSKMEGPRPDKFAFAKRSTAMKAPVGLLSDRTVLRSKMEGPRPDKFAFAKRSAAMKAPVGLLSDRTVLRSKMEGPCPDKFAFAKRSGAMKAPVGNALFVGIKVGRTTLAKVMPYMLMYYAAIILGLLLVTYIPAVSMVLPQVTGLV